MVLCRDPLIEEEDYLDGIRIVCVKCASSWYRRICCCRCLFLTMSCLSYLRGPKCQLLLRFLPCCDFHTSRAMSSIDFQPITGSVLPRFAGIASLLRLPLLSVEEAQQYGVDIGLIGVPYDGGTTNRPGARFGPRSVRDISTSIRNVNRATGVNPFTLCNCADLGDAPINPISIASTLTSLTSYYRTLTNKRITPLSIGGDHLISLPILPASLHHLSL